MSILSNPRIPPQTASDFSCDETFSNVSLMASRRCNLLRVIVVVGKHIRKNAIMQRRSKCTHLEELVTYLETSSKPPY
jgi:hypothetical protein